jgi:hypothetical protein
MSKPGRPRVVRIEIEWEDGMVRRAEGDDADAIHDHWTDLEVLNHMHGFRYRGPVLREVLPPTSLLGGQKDEVPDA